MSGSDQLIHAWGLGRSPSGVAVTGLGVALPERAVSNDRLGALIGTPGNLIEARTGIRSRRHAPLDVSVAMLATESARAALCDAELDGSQVDLVLLATVSQEEPLPNVAPQVASSVGAVRAGAFDIGAAGSGFISALITAVAFIESGHADTVLVIGADLLSRQTDPYDLRAAPIVGDGAGAVVLCAAHRSRITAVELGAGGRNGNPIETDRASGTIRIQGHRSLDEAVARMYEATLAVCARAGVDPAIDVDLFVFHQIDARVTRTLAAALKLTDKKLVDCIAELGNTSAGGLPLALDYARADGRLVPGTRVLLCAAGAGGIWGAALLEWGHV